MSTAYDKWCLDVQFVQREHQRTPLVLPASISFENEEYSVRLINLGRGGAMIECSASPPLRSSVLLRCGSVAANAKVIWKKAAQVGVRFHSTLSEQQIAELLARNIAIVSRQLSKRTVDGENKA